MAILIQIVCWMLFVSVTSARHTSPVFNQPFLSSYFDDTFDNDPFFTSGFDDFDDIFAKVDQEFERLDNMSSKFFKTSNEEMAKIQIKLDAVTPVCNTTEGSTTSTVANDVLVQTSQREQIRPTKTIVCFKELIDGRMKHIYREVKVTDDQDRILSQSSGYKSFTINTLNEIPSSRRLD